ALALGAQVLARALGVRVESAHVQQAQHALLLARLDELLGQLDVNAPEIRAVWVSAPPLEDADQVDRRVAARPELRARLGVLRIRLHDVDRGKEDQVLRALAPARRDHDEMPVVDELAHEVPADEAAAA